MVKICILNVVSYNVARNKNVSATLKENLLYYQQIYSIIVILPLLYMACVTTLPKLRLATSETA
jgi:hypothetical protein